MSFPLGKTPAAPPLPCSLGCIQEAFNFQTLDEQQERNILPQTFAI